MHKKICFLLALAFGSAVLLNAQPTISTLPELPKVFKLGANEAAYETLVQEYPQTLLAACNNDMKVAFDKWLEMMKALDDHARRINFDIKGIKVRLHVFWDADGSIKHIGYILRTDSRALEKEAEFGAFLSSFTRQYSFPVQSQQKYSHYSIATFPTYSERSE